MKNSDAKFTLPTLAVFVALVAIAMGWLSDRRKLISQLDALKLETKQAVAKANRAHDGPRIASAATERNSIARNFTLSPNVVSFRSKLEGDLLYSIERLFKRRADVDNASDIDEFSATNLAGRAIFLLGWQCATVDDFVGEMTLHYEGVPHTNYLGRESKDHPEFLRFLEDSFSASKQYAVEINDMNGRYANLEEPEQGIRGPETTIKDWALTNNEGELRQNKGSTDR